MQQTQSATVATNRSFYDELWSSTYMVSPRRFNTWPLVSALADSSVARLEIGPGLRPRLPVTSSYFVDISRPALSRLREGGAFVVVSDVATLPFADDTFDLVCAFDIVEHVEDDQQVFRELNRVARDGATIIFSVPLHQSLWNAFDDLVGHVRRYDPHELIRLLSEHSLTLERTAVFGMQPRKTWLLDFAVWAMTRRRAKALRWYNRLLLPIGLLLQPRLTWTAGLPDLTTTDELVIVCRRGHRLSASPAPAAAHSSSPDS